MNRLKNWFVGAALTIASAVGIHHVQPTTLEDHTPPIVVVGPTPAPTPISGQGSSKLPKMILGKITNASDQEIIMIKTAIMKANDYLATESFRASVLGAHFTEANGLSNEQIYSLLASKPIVIGVSMFDGTLKQNYFYKTMGLDRGDGVVYANRHFVEDAETMASLMIHEAEGHGQGFHHYNVKSSSVPYQFNDFIDQWFKDQMKLSLHQDYHQGLSPQLLRLHSCNRYSGGNIRHTFENSRLHITSINHDNVVNIGSRQAPDILAA